MPIGTPAQQKLVARFFQPFFNWSDDEKLREWLREQDADALEQFLNWFDFNTRRDRESLGRQELRKLRAAQDAVDAESWISAAEAVRLVTTLYNSKLMAQMAICKRAHAGLIRARAATFMVGDQTRSAELIPKGFWWAEGEAALEQNWQTGDFETWIENKTRLRAFGVTFVRADIDKMLPTAPISTPVADAQGATPVPKGGRPPADWWEDLLIDLCFKHFRGELDTKTQAGIVRAMQDWISERGYEAADSTIKIRARKLHDAVKRDVEN